jgi:hypothetical protein
MTALRYGTFRTAGRNAAPCRRPPRVWIKLPHFPARAHAVLQVIHQAKRSGNHGLVVRNATACLGLEQGCSGGGVSQRGQLSSCLPDYRSGAEAGAIERRQVPLISWLAPHKTTAKQVTNCPPILRSLDQDTRTNLTLNRPMHHKEPTMAPRSPPRALLIPRRGCPPPWSTGLARSPWWSSSTI